MSTASRSSPSPTTSTPIRRAGLPTPASTPSPPHSIKAGTRVPPSSAKSHASSTHARTPSMTGGRKAPLVGARRPSVDTHPPELVKASREVLIELAARTKRELAEAVEKNERLEEGSTRLLGERIHLEGEFERAKGRINELMVSESRMEEELAGRIEVLDKLRSSVRELEREKRDGEKRYREQADSFDSERQSWYDQEQHYKLRISNLSTTPRKPRLSDLPKPSLSDSDNDFVPRRFPESPKIRSTAPSPNPSGPTPVEAALQDQLSSLTTAHDSLTTTLRALQVELGELKRVYQDLQEENESYEVLLGQKTMSGEIEVLFRRSWGSSEGDSFASGGQPGAGLESVGESDEGDEEVDVEKILLETQGIGSANSGAVQAGTTPGGKKKMRKSTSTGLDLAAELEAAQWADEEEEEESTKPRRKPKREATSEDAMRNEIRHLREANKALTLYVSKIVDRVCSQEGFEKVLAVDYKHPLKPVVSSPPSLVVPPPVVLSPVLPPPTDLPLPRQRPSSTYFRRSSATSSSGTRDSPSLSSPPPPLPPSTASHTSPLDRRRKTMSISWDSVSWLGSAFAGPVSPPLPTQPAGFKPLMLGTIPPPAPEPVGRKLETEEDEEDRRERERLRAEMALLGISEPGTAWSTSYVEGSGGKVVFPTTEGRTPFRREPLPSGEDEEDEARKAMEQFDEKEREARAELEMGRASGFTEQRVRRPRAESRRSSSSAIGLGIQEGGGEEKEEPVGWGKTLRRVSLGWSSPVV